MRQQLKIYRRQDHQDLHNSSVAVMLREMQREVNMGRPFETRLHIDYNTNNLFYQLRPAGDFDCCFWGKPPGPRIMRNFLSNSREQTQGNEKRKGEDSSYPKGIRALQRNSSKGLSRPRGSQQSHGCTSRLCYSSVWASHARSGRPERTRSRMPRS